MAWQKSQYITIIITKTYLHVELTVLLQLSLVCTASWSLIIHTALVAINPPHLAHINHRLCLIAFTNSQKHTKPMLPTCCLHVDFALRPPTSCWCRPTIGQRSDGGRSRSLARVSGTIFPLMLYRSTAGCLQMALEDKTFSPLLQCCLTVTFFTLIVVLEIDFLLRPL